MEEKIAGSDSRRRPDIRALENGDLEVAAFEKVGIRSQILSKKVYFSTFCLQDRLENKQREYRKPFKGQKESDWWTPRLAEWPDLKLDY